MQMKDGLEESIHDARIATRRVRELLRVPARSLVAAGALAISSGIYAKLR